MNVIEAKAWSCGICNKLWQYNDKAKQLANACCRCRTKDCNNHVEYTGTVGILCRICKLREDLPDLKRSMERSEQEYKNAVEQLTRIENRGK